ncbi:MAG TPA: PRC and DUF2382 domain-containing protein [Methylomirabilota bacterium]|nr:PRC and DUF2382 domain-containing protein [Methylomirabilota bacterium]
MGTAGAGPIGTGIGAAVGAIVGGLAGKGTAEGLNPTTDAGEGRFIDYTVVDSNEEKVGTVDSVWLDNNNDPAYLAVRTGWLGMGRHYVVPAQNAHVQNRSRQIRLPYTLEQLRGAPEFDSSASLQTADEERIGTYFGSHGFKRDNWLRQEAAQRPAGGATAPEEARVQLKEEQVKVGKREVEYGGVRLRKVVRTEVVQQPVELKREEIVIERVPVGEAAPTSDFTDEEIYVPLRREEAVVAKEAHVTEEVRLGKRQEREQQTVSETVRKEDVEIQQEGEASRVSATGTRERPAPYQPKERSRS